MEIRNDKLAIAGLKVVPLLPAIFVCVAFLLNLSYSLPIKDSLLFYAGVFLFFFIPGSLLLRWLSPNKDEYFTSLFLSVALGAALMPLLYIVIRRLSHPELLHIFIILIFLLWFILKIRDLKEKKGDVYTSPKDILSALVLIGAVFILLHLSHFTDAVFLDNEFKIRNTYLTEGIFHLGIINMLKNVFPPVYPYASGIDFSFYHLNMHLEIEMFNRLFMIDTLKLTFFFFPLLYFLLLVFLPYILIRKCGGTELIGVIAGILMFGSDLSFVPGMLGMFPPDYPWIAFFTPTIWSLFTLNGYLPALFVMFLCILYLKKYYVENKLLYLILFSVLGFSAYGFKSSMGFHIIGSAFLTGIVSTILDKDRKKGMFLCIASLFIFLVIVMDIIIFRSGTGNYILRIDFLNLFHNFLRNIGLANMPIIITVIVLAVYILISFGSRSAIFYFSKDIIKRKGIDFVIVFLGIFVIIGFSVAEFIYLGDPFMTINNSIWFSVQSLMGAWILLFIFLSKIKSGKKFHVILTMIILLSVPSTVQFLNLRFDKSYYDVNRGAIEIIKFLETTPPTSTILHPLNLDGPSLASNLAGRRSVLSVFRSFAIVQTEVERREKDVELFFSQGGAVNRLSIIKKYKVDYVYAPVSYAIYLDKEPMLLRVLKNSEYVLYKVDIGNSASHNT